MARVKWFDGSLFVFRGISTMGTWSFDLWSDDNQVQGAWCPFTAVISFSQEEPD